MVTPCINLVASPSKETVYAYKEQCNARCDRRTQLNSKNCSAVWRTQTRKHHRGAQTTHGLSRTKMAFVKICSPCGRDGDGSLTRPRLSEAYDERQ